jgi:hypothetical protein
MDLPAWHFVHHLTMKHRFLIILLILVLAGLVAGSFFVSIPYNVHSRGIVLPVKEWSLKKSGDGMLVSVYKDNLRNTITDFSVTEFQRGELAGFRVNEEILGKEFINTGDTIGIISSSEEERRYIEMVAQLQVQKSLLKVHASGEKPETVQMAYEAMIKAEHEYETQKKVTARNEVLFNDKYISAEEYELSHNDYLVKKHNMNIARSSFEAVSTGAKEEQLNFLMASINALELQLRQVEERLQSFHILAPIDGKLVGRRITQPGEEIVISIADSSRCLVVLPVEMHQLPYIKAGQLVILKPGSFGVSFTASIISVDNVVQMNSQRQNVFITASIHENSPGIIPGMVVEASIRCGMVSVKDYFTRLFRTVYAN